MRILDEVGLAFDDVLLVPRKSSITSRFNGEIDLSVDFLPGLKINYPIISANMDKVSGSSMVKALVGLGAIGIIHRFSTFEAQAEGLREVPEGYRIGCVGVGKIGRDRLKFLTQANLNLSGVLIDVAHGHSVYAFEQIAHIRKEYPELPIIAGNVATYDAAKDLVYAGVHSMKVGVGSGSLCETRVYTGNGVPQLTAVMECRRAVEDTYSGTGWKPTIISDGGIRNGGDCVKTLASGADLVMLGNVFAGTSEAPGKLIRVDGRLCKNYRGSASREAQEDWKGKATSIEGESIMVPYKGPVEDVFREFLSGVRSGFSYQDAHNIKELQKNAVFIRQTTAGYIESTPHGVRR